MATALENNGATVYILGRRFDVREQAAKANAVSSLSKSSERRTHLSPSETWQNNSYPMRREMQRRHPFCGRLRSTCLLNLDRLLQKSI